MSSSKDGVKGKLRAGVMITLLLIAAVVVGAVLVNLNSASQAGNAPAPQVNAPSDAERDAQTLPSPVIPEKVASLDLSGGAAAAGLKPGEKKVLPNGVIVTLNSRHDLSPALRDIPPAPDVANDEPPENPYVQKLNTNPVKDTIVQRFFGPVAMPTPILTFEGISNPTGCGGCAPPDTNGAVGPNNYVQTVNVKFQIWDKSGNSLYGPVNVNTLFSGFGGPCQTQNSGDPVVNYDRAADRWVISQFTSSSPFSQCVAVSQTSDPTGAYYRYEFRESATNLYDYPKMGVWIDGYYMTANVFNLGTGEFLYPAFLAMDRAAMLQGQPATSQEFNPGNYYYAVLPADIDSALLPAPGSREPFLSASGNDTTLRIWNLHVDFTTPTNSRLDGPTNLAAVPWDPNLCGLARNCIPQPTVPASQYLDSLGDHAMFRLAYRNFGSYEAMVTNESVDVGGDQAGVRWYEIRDPNGTPSIYQQGTYAPDSTNRWMGSIAMDRDGNIAVGYSASSTTVFPSIRYAGRLSTDPLGQLGQGETTLFAGSGSQSDPSGRWGDYSDMTIDPSDDCT
ncbi:MAG: hypothetical protein IVW55_15875, partial [Chloroflexi bacterium]|nr:hypothetical protein [Chloroflexota bacterium]